MRTKWERLPAFLRFIITTLAMLVFLFALFCAGMAAYAAITQQSYVAAWQALIASMRK